MPADAGIRFGQYVLVRRIARGGMAEVFLAQQRGLEGFDRRVAVKRILPHLADSPDFTRMFLSEAKLAAQLTHPNIVHIYEFGKVGDDYFIAMEFVDGVHAGQLFQEEIAERLSPTLVARIGADAAAALHYAHELRGPNGKSYGLVHRDVSPANIMISFDGIVKLCDFGIAKAAAAGDQLTNPGQVKGKYAYMSPEQTTAQPLDGRSDVFSLAICMWELLTGKFIVPRGDAVAAMRMIRDGKLEPLERAAPQTPAPLVKAIQWALEPRREKRATAADLAQALEAFIKSSPELATPMQLAAWVRGRFARVTTGEQRPVDASLGTQGASGQVGTAAAPKTASVASLPAFKGPAAPTPPVVSPAKLAALEPPPLPLPTTPPVYPARRAPKYDAKRPDFEEESSTIKSSELDEEGATIKTPRYTGGPPLAATIAARGGVSAASAKAAKAANAPRTTASSPTILADAGMLPGSGPSDSDTESDGDDATEIAAPQHRDSIDATRPRERESMDATAIAAVRHAPESAGEATVFGRPRNMRPADEDSTSADETVLRDTRPPISSGPSVVPTRVQQGMPASLPPPRHLAPTVGAPAVPPANGAPSAGGGYPAPSVYPSPVPGSLPGPGGMPGYPTPPPGALGGPPAHAIAMARAESSHGYPRPGSGQHPAAGYGAPEDAERSRRTKRYMRLAGLGGIALFSFMIALAASNHGSGHDPRRPGSLGIVPADANGITGEPIDEAPLDAREPTDNGASDSTGSSGPRAATGAEAAPPAQMALLVVRTTPDGGTIRVGDHVAEAARPAGATTRTAQLLLDAGRYTVTAELPGWEPEKREILLDSGENKTLDIEFTTRAAATSRPRKRGR